MNFNSEIVGAYWQDETSEWKVEIKQQLTDGSIEISEQRCDVLLYGTGILNSYKWPDISGLDSFKGKVTSQYYRVYLTFSDVQSGHPYSKLATGLQGGRMEERKSGSHWIWSIIDSNSSHNATTCSAHGHLCEDR